VWQVELVAELRPRMTTETEVAIAPIATFIVRNAFPPWSKGVQRCTGKL
jgi:hypothetical protein